MTETRVDRKPGFLWAAELFPLMVSAVPLVIGVVTLLYPLQYIARMWSRFSWSQILELVAVLAICAVLFGVNLIGPILSMRRARPARAMLIGTHVVNMVAPLTLMLILAALVAALAGDERTWRSPSASPYAAMATAMGVTTFLFTGLALVPSVVFAAYLGFNRRVREWYLPQPT